MKKLLEQAIKDYNSIKEEATEGEKQWYMGRIEALMEAVEYMKMNKD